MDFVVLDNGMLLSESGCLTERLSNGGRGSSKEPPTDVHELAKLKAIFWERKLALAIEEFDLEKQRLISGSCQVE